MSVVVDQLPRSGKRELFCLLLFTCNYVVSVWRGFLFLWVLGMGYVILLWHSLSIPYNYFENRLSIQKPVSRKKTTHYPISDLFLNVLLYIFEAKKGCRKKFEQIVIGSRPP